MATVGILRDGKKKRNDEEDEKGEEGEEREEGNEKEEGKEKVVASTASPLVDVWPLRLKFVGDLAGSLIALDDW